MDYQKTKIKIENAIHKNKSDFIAYEDYFSLCRNLAATDFITAQK